MTIPYVIYPFDCMVEFEPDYKELKKRLNDRGIRASMSFLKGSGTTLARTIMFEGGQTLIMFKSKNPTPGIISHEAFHAVHFLMERIKTPLTYDTCEAFAYLLEYLVNKINAQKETEQHKS